MVCKHATDATQIMDLLMQAVKYKIDGVDPWFLITIRSTKFPGLMGDLVQNQPLCSGSTR